MHGSAPFLRPLFLARPTLVEDTMEEERESPDIGEITAQMLETLLASDTDPEALLTHALTYLRRGLNLDFAAVYYVTPAQPERLTLCAAEGLPTSFAETAHTISLWDFADIADMPYNGAHPPAYGDFFSPVAAAYGMKAGLIASLTHAQDGTVIGALLLGSRNPLRFDAAEAVQISIVARRLAGLLTFCSLSLQHAA